LPASFTAWFQKALNRNIASRFQTAKEFADGLTQAFNLTHGPPSYAALPSRPSGSIDFNDPTEQMTRKVSPEASTQPPAARTSGAKQAAAASQPGAPEGQTARSSKLGFVASPPAVTDESTN